MSVTCSACGQRWAMDPALLVKCPVCNADVGRRCKRPSGHVIPGELFHAERDRLAMKTVPGYGPCPAAATPEGGGEQ